MTESRSFEDVYKVQTERIAQLEHELAALRERLAQPEQEPVAWIYSPLIGDGPKERRLTFVHPSAWGTQLGLEITPLYAAPKSRQWQRLTDEEIDTWNIVGHESLREFVRAIEAKLKEKNT